MIELFLQEDLFMTKEERAAKRAEKKAAKKNKPSLFEEFKAFISKGNAFMLAVGVVIGGAFSAIVTAFVNILLSVATWAVPGGLKGFVTVLPAFPGSPAQAGASFLCNGEIIKVNKILVEDVNSAVVQFAAAQGRLGLTVEDADFIQWKNSMLGLYTQHGGVWTYNMSAVIDWGALLTAVISFLIIAIVLFIIVKAVATVNAKKAELEAKALEAHYKKHPEERPAPVEPGLPEPTEKDILVQIRDLLKEKK